MANSEVTEESLLKKYNISEIRTKVITDSHIQEIPNKCCNSWKDLRPHLKLKEVDEKNLIGSTESDKTADLLRMWRQKNGSDATYGALLVAVLKAGHRNDAESICELLKTEMMTSETSAVAQESEMGPPPSKKRKIVGKVVTALLLVAGGAASGIAFSQLCRNKEDSDPRYEIEDANDTNRVQKEEREGQKQDLLKL